MPSTIRILPLLLGVAAVPFTARAGEPPPPLPPLPEETEAIGASVELGFESDYVFRGIPVSENNLWGAVNLTIPVSGELSLSLSSWYTTGTSGHDYEELDLSAALVYERGITRFGIGYTTYQFMDGQPGSLADLNDAHELGLTLSAELPGVDLFAGYYYDFSNDGQFIELGVNAPVVLTDHLALVPTAVVSYGIDSYTSRSGFQHLKLALAAPIKLTPQITLAPFIAGNIPLSTLNAEHDSDVYGGVKLTIVF